MLKSIKRWVNIPFQFKPFLSVSGSGSKTYDTVVSDKCYPEGKVKVVTNSFGKEVVSNKQLYVDGTSSIKEEDLVLFEGRETEIKSIGYFYANGVVDLKVVYL